MPFYEYQCKNCGHELEAMQKVSDAPLKKCPHCGKSQLQRLMSAPVFRLKGGGWYETDFKGDKENQRNLADRPEAEASKDSKDAGTTAKDGKDANGKDAKPDAKGTDKGADLAAAKESTAAGDKSAGKAEKSAGSDHKPAGGADKPTAGKVTSAAGRSRAKRPAKKPAAKASRRR